MTQLIDGDALEKAIYKWMPKYEGTWMDGWISPIENLMILIMMTIQEQPAVDAVPIKWLTAQAENPSNSDELRNAIDYIVYTLWAERDEK